MQLFNTVADLREALKEVPQPLGLVPTMGALHAGHRAMVQRARRENATTAVCIFVNRAQFDPQEDFEAYPRNLDRDLKLLEEEGVELVFAPPVEAMYPPGFDTWVEVGGLSRRLEGERRSGHFRGVCTIVLKLFNLLRPQRAYFGQKDAQQLLVVRRMAQDLDLGVEVVMVPTVREPDGLAFSSRNAYLDQAQRQVAPVLYHALCLAHRRFEEGSSVQAIKAEMRALIDAEPLAHPDYVSIADIETLEELEALDRPALASLAVYIGKARLIDNIFLA